MFNGLRVSVEGKISAVREGRKLQADSLERRIARAVAQIPEAAQDGRLNQAHHQRRRLANLRRRLATLEADSAAGRVRLCFGSKRLWRKQHHLEANGYTRAMRSGSGIGEMPAVMSSLFWGAGMRRRGCQLCVASIG